MSNIEQFDDFFKKELQNFSPEVPADAWEKLLQAKERKRPVIAWWRNSKYLLLLACIVGASILLPLLFLNSSSKVNTNKLVGNEATTTNNLPNNSNESNQTASNAKTVDNKPNENNKNATNAIADDNKPNENNHNASSNAIAVDKKSNENNQLSPTTKNNQQPNIDVHTTVPSNRNLSVTYAGKNATVQKVADKTNFLTLTHATSKRGIEKAFIDNNIKKNSNQSVIGASKNKLTNASTNKPTAFASIDHLSKKVLNTPFQTKKNKKGIEIADDQDIVDNTSTTIIEDGNWLTNKVPIAVDKIYYNQSNENARIIINKAAIKSPDCPANEKNAVGKIKYFTFYAGPDLVSKKYTDTSNSTLLNKRKESTAIISAFSAGLNYTNVFANGVSFSAGINYSQINEKFNFIQGNVVQNTYVIDPNTGDTTSRSTVVGTRYKTTINRYRTIDVPLTIGYEMGNTNLHVNAYAGAVINVYSWQKGDMLGVDLQPVSITTGKASAMYRYKTNIGVGLIGGASIFYKLNDKLHLMAQPYCRYNFAPLNNTTLSLQEKFFTIGVRLGIRFDL